MRDALCVSLMMSDQINDLSNDAIGDRLGIDAEIVGCYKKLAQKLKEDPYRC